MLPTPLLRSPLGQDPAGRNRVIDAWRACACLAVVGVHGAVLDGLDNVHPTIATLSPWMEHGWLGVPVFFVLSGYCLAASLGKRPGGHVTALTHFWADRLLRIYPTYWVAWLVACLLATVATPFNGLPATSAWPESLLHATTDLTLTNVWLEHAARLTVSWSLAYEIGFYSLIGLALAAPRGSPRLRLLICAAITISAHLPAVAACLPLLGFWPQFACGIAVHAAGATHLPPAARLLALCYPIILCGHSLANGAAWAWFAPACSLLFFLTLHTRTFPSFVLACLAPIGRASYSIYLVHIPFMGPMLNLSRRALAEHGGFFAIAWLAHLALGVAAGLVFYHTVERRLERWRPRALHSLFLPADPTRNQTASASQPKAS